VDARAVEELRELGRRDAELATEGDRLQALDTEVGAIRARAEELEAFFLAYPETEQRLRAAHGAAVAGAADDEARAAAERALARARDHVETAEARVARTMDEQQAHENEVSAATAELPELAGRATAAGVSEAGEPGDTPRELVDWAARAHATLFVAVGQLDAQRDRIVREANELATMLLGEPTYGASAAQALSRVEESL
jgi:hypothetical protein